ncbi:MAG: ABC transporter ATP-binding protein, partial [Oscillospiraceae bacterium]|nr:ABC transporter ATP-binding protein [Oscillospiraceae bacterium]
NRFIELLIEEKARGKTILMSSHMFEEVERTCHRVGILRDGRLVTVDSADALREKHVKKYTVTLESAETAASFAEDFGGRADGARATVSARQSLEEIFMQYYGGDE